VKPFLIVLCIAATLYTAQTSVTIDLGFPVNGSVTPDTRTSSNPLVAHTQDSSIPLPTTFSWSVHGNATPLQFDLFVSEDTVFDSLDFFRKDIPDTFFLLWNLKIDTRYYWKVSAHDDQNSKWDSPIGFFTTNPSWPRMLQLDGTTNVRDIGGRKTPEGFLIRQGLFYRSAEIGRHFPVTEKGMQQLKELRISSDFDLRRMDEDPQPLLSPPVRYIHPLKDDSSNGVYQYKEGLISTADVYAKVFKALADPRNYPLILHCYAGLDRTGTVAAIVEALLGCSEQQIGDDYQWSALSQFSRKDTSGEEWKGTISYLKSFDGKDSTSVQAGAWNYLLKQGVTIDDIVSIRKILINNDQIPPFVSIINSLKGSGGFKDAADFYMLSSTFVSLFPKIKCGRQTAIYNCQGKKMLELYGVASVETIRSRLAMLGPGIYFVRNRQ
jgi:hypothetical protein